MLSTGTLMNVPESSESSVWNRRGPPDLAVVVFAESDTVAHHYWRDHDADSPRHDPSASEARKGALTAVYERLDAACGTLREAFGSDALCAVVSDHGSGGASRHVVHLNAFLSEAGFLRRRPLGAMDGLARGARDALLRLLPGGVTQRLFRGAAGAAARVESLARFGGLDWSATSAFSEEANTQPGVWINLRGREAEGCVAPDAYERVRDELIAALKGWKLPSGDPVVARARRREDVYPGPLRDRAPDVVVELALDAGYGLSLVPTPWGRAATPIRRLEGDELAGGRGRGMNGTHRPDGVWLTAEPDHAWPRSRPTRLEQVAPAVLAALGVPWESELDTREASGARDYTDVEAKRVEERLRALGYLE